MATFGYVRVSSDEQKKGGTSPELQKARIQGQAAAQSLGEAQIFEDTESGAAEKEEDRIQQKLLISKVRSGDTILVTKVDRWSRDIVFGVQSVRDLIKKGVKFLALDENIDASTPQGDSMLGLMSWVADQERKRIVERTMGARKRLREQGDHVEGRPPVGYMRADKINGRRPDRKLHPSSEAPIIKEIFERCVAGDSLRTILGYLQRQHSSRNWTRKQVNHILRSKEYLGMVRRTARAEDWISSHEPLIDEATFALAQKALGDKRVGGKGRTTQDAEARTQNWLLRGLANCAHCQRRIGASYSAKGTGKGGKDLNYYACNGRLSRGDAGQLCVNRYMAVDRVDQEVARLLHDRLLELRQELVLPPPQSGPEEVPDFEAQLAKLAVKKKRLIDGYTNELIQLDDFRTRVKEIDRQVGEVERARAEHLAAHRAQAPACRADLLTEVEALERAIGAMTPVEKREVLGMLAAWITLEAGGKRYRVMPTIKIQWHPLEVLLTRRAG